MTDQEINVQIAEIRGWTEVKLAIRGAGGGTRIPTPYGKPPGKKYMADCPDYCNDLNAIAEAEKATFGSSDIWKEFAINLLDTIKCESMSELDVLCCVIQATARQHAETFLRTLGKWKEAK
jgi:hypothetical protein